MERAGAEDMGNDVERKGLGTSATRADVIEKLVKDGFAKREKKQMIPTEDGVKLITVLPDMVKELVQTYHCVSEEQKTMFGSSIRRQGSYDAYLKGKYRPTITTVSQKQKQRGEVTCLSAILFIISEIFNL